MRIEANTPEGGAHYAVLDGKRVPFAIWADDETGEVAAVSIDETTGRAKRDANGLIVEILKGVVTFEAV